MLKKTMLSRIGYHTLSTYSDGPMKQSGENGRFAVMCRFYFEEDMTPLFPYINADADGAELYDHPPMVRFVFNHVYCVVYPDRCIASPMESRDAVRALAEGLVAYLGAVWCRRDEIVPKYTRFKSGAVPEIFKLLPGTNCGDCGMKTCMAFAAMLAKQKILPGQCPYMGRPLAQTYPVFDTAGRQVSQVTLHLDGRSKEGDSKLIPARTAHNAAPGTPSPKPGKNDRIGDILPDPLTQREMQVLALMGEGRTNPEISTTLSISPHTVKSHVINIFNKLGVNHRTQAVVWAARQGII